MEVGSAIMSRTRIVFKLIAQKKSDTIFKNWPLETHSLNLPTAKENLRKRIRDTVQFFFFLEKRLKRLQREKKVRIRYRYIDGF